jgi:hypothetical protein
VIHLLLLDVDGVLVDARGYLKALQDSVAHFSRRMGIGDHPPTEEEVRVFEAHGLGCEWDSGSLLVAYLLLERLRREPAFPLPPAWPDALSALAAHPHPVPHPDYAALARQVAGQMQKWPSAAQAARAVLRNEAQAIPELAPSLPALAALLDTLLGHTYDFYRAPLTRHFQHLVIGSQAVAKTYDIVPDFESPAYLRQYDRPLLSVPTRVRLDEAVAREQARIALYTARPSLPPVEVDGPTAGYSPEAEIARALVGLEAYPIIGMGKMRWLAEQVGQEVGRLVKPSPVQALAAVGTAWSGQERPALEAALAFHDTDEPRQAGPWPSPLAQVGPATVHVFEDTPGGLAAVERACEALRAAGRPISWQLHGIAPADSPKAAMMRARGVPVYASINEALQAALMGSGS